VLLLSSSLVGAALLPVACGARSALEADGRDVALPGVDAGQAGSDPVDASGGSGGNATPRPDAGAGAWADCGPTEPIVVAQDEVGLNGLALDETYAYFANTIEGTVKRVDLCTAEVITVVGEERSIMGLAVDATHVYWGTVGKLARTPLSGGSDQVLWQVSSMGIVEGIALDETDVYFTYPTSVSEGLQRVPKAGGPATVLGNPHTRSVVVDEAWVYFEGWLGNQLALQRMPKTGGAGEALYFGEVWGTIVANDTHVYFAHWDGPGFIQRVPKQGGAVELIHSGSLGIIAGLALGDGLMYWTSHADEAIFVAPDTGGNAIEIRNGLDGPQAVALNGQWIVWLTYGTGEVRRSPT
jgi:hypothetical protein